MKKVIKAQLYIKKTYCDVDGKYICDTIDSEIEGWPIDYQCGKAIYKDKEVTAFEVYIEANKRSDAETFYRYFKVTIKNITGKNVYQIIKINADKI